MKTDLLFKCLLLLVVILVSCDKGQELPPTDSKNSLVVSGFKSSRSEEAFPDVKGEIVKFELNDEDIFVEKFGDQYVFMGDMILTKEQVAILKGDKNARTAVAEFVKHWGSGVVYYTISSALPSPQRVIDAINHWESVTSIDFQVRTNQSDYVEFVVGDGCSSSVGRSGGRQTINLAAGCQRGEVIHEIGHAIGFFHEQARTDRNNSIIINTQNIENGKEHNFQTYAQRGLSGFQFGAFDFESIMLYSSWDFSKNGLPTIERVDHSTFIAQRNGLSPGDIETVIALYGPPFAKVRKVQLSYDSNSSGTTSYYNEDAEYFVDFYNDRACTSPYTGTAPRVASVRKQIDQPNGFGGITVTFQDYLFTEKANGGSGSIWLGQFFNYENTNYGDIISASKVDFFVTSANKGNY